MLIFEIVAKGVNTMERDAGNEPATDIGECASDSDKGNTGLKELRERRRELGRSTARQGRLIEGYRMTEPRMKQLFTPICQHEKQQNKSAAANVNAVGPQVGELFLVQCLAGNQRVKRSSDAVKRRTLTSSSLTFRY